jgi:hypothetical protein
MVGSYQRHTVGPESVGQIAVVFRNFIFEHEVITEGVVK